MGPMSNLKVTDGYLFDSNIIVALLNKDPSVLDFIKQSSIEKKLILFSNISVCEIYSGLKKEELTLVNKLFSKKRCIDVTLNISIQSGLFRQMLRKEGRRIKTPDAIIATTAKLYNLDIVTRDYDFRNLEEHGIKVIKI
jgi:tRNA(fMet)-specific endonuclease VapC